MAADPLDALRLTLMQDVLPVGLAVVERARRGGPREVMAVFDGRSPDPLGELRQEGEPAASQLRDNLDRLQPGLGNPVMRVEVREEPGQPAPETVTAVSRALDERELEQHLGRIEARLQLLEQRLLAEAR